MEGATSKIIPLGNGWVRKQLTRKSKKNTRITPIKQQIEFHKWSAATLTPANGFTILFTPSVRATGANNSYEMQQIDSSKMMEKITHPALKAEVLRYFQLAKAKGYYPNDFELYVQPDGRVALLDFDKFGLIQSDGVAFPFRGKVPLNHEVREAIFSESLARQIQSVMKGGRRHRTRRNRV